MCQAHPVLVKKGESNVRFVSFRSGPPVDGPKDPWPRVLSLPGWFVGDPASLARNNIVMLWSISFFLCFFLSSSSSFQCTNSFLLCLMTRKEILLCNHKSTWICRLFLNYCYESSLIFFPRWNKYRLICYACDALAGKGRRLLWFHFIAKRWNSSCMYMRTVHIKTFLVH